METKATRSIQRLAESITLSAEKQQTPEITLPQRTLDNTVFNRSTRMLDMGTKRTHRELFNVGQAKAFMQSVLIASGCKKLIDGKKTTSLRGLYYMLKHTIANTREETFNDQLECDTIIEDLEVALSLMREEMGLYASAKGNIAGALTLIDGEDTIDCAKSGSGGYQIPSIVEPENIAFIKCDAKFILHVEKDTVWRRFSEDKFWRKHDCLITHGGGQPPRGVRRLLYRLHHELGLPVYCLLDNDPWGYYIYSVIKQGSINLAHESSRMAIPAARFLGVRSQDYSRLRLNKSVTIGLSDKDEHRVKQIAKYPWFINKAGWQKEVQEMLANGFKLEVESLIAKGLSYVTDTYVPERLAEREWLD